MMGHFSLFRSVTQSMHGAIMKADYGHLFPFITSYNFFSKTHPWFGLCRMIRSAPASLSSVLIRALVFSCSLKAKVGKVRVN